MPPRRPPGSSTPRRSRAATPRAGNALLTQSAMAPGSATAKVAHDAIQDLLAKKRTPRKPVELPDLPQTPYALLWARMIRGLETEIEVVESALARWGGDLPAQITVGRYDEALAEGYVYTLSLARPVYPPPFTAVDVQHGATSRKGTVDEVAPDGRTLTVTLDDRLPEEGRGGFVIFNPTAVLKACLGELLLLPPDAAGDAPPAVARALGYAPTQTGDQPVITERGRLAGLNDGQVAAGERVAGSELTLVLGPPGTGKTKTLGATVAGLVERLGERTLVAAHTNVALDTAMASVAEVIDPSLVAEGRVVRLGRVVKEFQHLRLGLRDATGRANVLKTTERASSIDRIEAELDHLVPPPAHKATLAAALSLLPGALRKPETPELRTQKAIDRIVAALGDPATPGAARFRLQELRSACDQLVQDSKNSMQAVVRQARVVGATLAKLMLEPALFADFDAIVIDEGSMAALPYVTVAAARAGRRLALFGDPRQLPPIVQAESPEAAALGLHLYTQLGLADPAIEDPRRPWLTVQYRMAPAIRALISEMFYAGRLVDAPSIATRPPRVEGLASLVLLDSSDTDAVATVRDGSRFNERHVAIVSEVVHTFVRAGVTDIGVITPFNPQQKLLRETIGRIVPGFHRLGGFVRTIHRAQGGEQDVIILDLVDAGARPSQFLNETTSIGRALPQLLNVALSRARHHLVIVAHTATFRRGFGRRGLVIGALEAAVRQGQYLRLPADGSTSDLGFE